MILVKIKTESFSSDNYYLSCHRLMCPVFSWYSVRYVYIIDVFDVGRLEDIWIGDKLLRLKGFSDSSGPSPFFQVCVVYDYSMNTVGLLLAHKKYLADHGMTPGKTFYAHKGNSDVKEKPHPYGSKPAYSKAELLNKYPLIQIATRKEVRAILA